MKFVDKSDVYEEARSYESELQRGGYFEIVGYNDIDSLALAIRHDIPDGTKKAYARFNDKFFVFDESDMPCPKFEIDELYKCIVGKTKAEWDAFLEKRRKDYLKEEEEWKEKIPVLTVLYTRRLENLVDDAHRHLVRDCVEKCLDSIYREHIVESLIEIMEFAPGKTFEEIENKLNEQGHSNMSYGITIMLFGMLSDFGKQFYDWARTV